MGDINVNGRIVDAAYQVSRPLVNWFWRRNILKVFNIYWHASHVCQVTQNILFPQALESMHEKKLFEIVDG